MKGLAKTVLTWEGKVFAAVDATEMNWKHKVTPDQGDSIKGEKNNLLTNSRVSEAKWRLIWKVKNDNRHIYPKCQICAFNHEVLSAIQKFVQLQNTYSK